MANFFCGGDLDLETWSPIAAPLYLVFLESAILKSSLAEFFDILLTKPK